MPEKYANQFDAKGVTFSMQDHLMMIDIDNAFATAKITTHGGSVLSFMPKQGAGAGRDVLWVSENAVFSGKKPVRGGIPVCWPWFGQAAEAGLPAHGFVRQRVWHLERVHTYENGVTEIILGFDSTKETLEIWPHTFHLELKVEVGEHLTMTLTTQNLNDYDLLITEAFHTYFNVSNCEGVEIDGLQKSILFDKLTQADGIIQQDIVTVKPPMDNVYLNQTGLVSFVDKGFNRCVQIEKTHAASSVVWNPGSEGVKAFDDMMPQAWQQMLCVEAGNVLDNAVLISSESKHQFTMVISVK